MITRRDRALKIALIAIASLLTILMIAIAIVTNILLTPEKLTPMVRGIAQEHIKSEFSIGEIELTFFSSFPRFEVAVDSLVIKQENHDVDDLINARRCVVAFNPFALLHKKIVINEIMIENTAINLYVDSLTRPMALFKFDTDTTSNDEGINFKEYEVELDRVKIDSSTIVIDDREKDFFAKVGGLSVDMGMSLAKDVSRLDTEVSLEEFNVRMQEKVFASKMSLGLKTKLKHYRDSSLLTLNNTTLNVNGIELRAEGSLRGDKEEVMVNIESTMSTPSITEFLELIPPYLFDDKDEVTASGNVDMQLNINGIYNNEQYPEMKAKLIIKDGKASYASRKLAIEKIDCDADMLIDLNEPSRSYTTINSFFINTSNVISMAVDGKITNMIEDPHVNVNINSDIDFDRLVEVFPLHEGVTLSGKNNSDLHTQFRLKDLETSNYGNLYIDGVSKFNNVAIDVDGALFSQDSTATSYLKVDITDGTLLFGDRVRENNSRTLLATIDVNGLGFKDKSGQYASIKNLKLTSGANFDSKSKKTNGVGIRGVAQNSVIGIEDQIEMKLGTTDALFTINPKNEKHKTIVSAVINSQSIEANERLYNSNISLSNVDMNLEMLRLVDRTDEVEGQQFETKWDTDGKVGFQHLKMYSDLFPINMSIPRSKVSVKNSRITLDNARLKLGESTIIATGYITNMIRVFFFDSDRGIEGELNIKSPLLNVNELIRATNQSVIMQVDSVSAQPTIPILAQNETEITTDNLVEETTQPAQQPIAQQSATQQDTTALKTIEPTTESDSTGMMPLVPKNINFKFDLNVDRVKVYETYVENIAGRATIDKGVLSLDRLTLDAIGAKAWSSLRYENIDPYASSVLFNMQLDGAEVNRIHELMPSVTAMIPMINSVNGAVDFDFTTSLNIDQELNVDMETLRAAASIDGKNLILRDSKDFEELADAMMFKNKDQSKIESLKVNMIADKSNVRVLPFEIAIDRYKAIIGGEQTIDIDKMSVDYDYNISVIKSPLPFKAGVDVFGVNEDFDFKVTKAKLKKSNFNALQEEYDTFKESIK